MTTPNHDPFVNRSDALLRRGFKTLNPGMVLLWRLGFGRWLNMAPRYLGRYLVLVHTGRKSGRTYQTPINYANVYGQLYCTAGFGSVSDWYRNLMANPSCQIWLPDGWYRAIATDVTDAENATMLLREVLIGSAFAARAAGLDPLQMSDADLEAATKDYRLLHLERTEALTGPGGPGDLAGVWPVATAGLLALLPLMWIRRRPTTIPDPPDSTDDMVSSS